MRSEGDGPIRSPRKKVWYFLTDPSLSVDVLGGHGRSVEVYRKQEQVSAAREADIDPEKKRRIHETGAV